MIRVPDIQHFIPPLEALQRLMDHINQRGIVIGGVAVSILGKPRMTADLDAMLILSMDEIPQLIKVAGDLGIIPRIDNILEFGRENHVLLLRHQGSGMIIAITLGSLPFEVEIIERSQEMIIGNTTIHLPTPEDLIIMKAIAHRMRDMLDISGIIETNPNLDERRIEDYLRQFALALDMHDILGGCRAII